MIRAAGSSVVGSAVLSGTGRPVHGQPGESWPQFGHDDANTGHAPDNTGPIDDIRERWTYTADHPDLDEQSGLSSSPAAVDGTVYVGSWDGTLHALDAGDGAKEWEYETGGTVRSSPAVVDDTVYVGGGDAVFAVDASDGSDEWGVDTGGYVSSPAVVDGTVYVGSNDRNVYALDASDGTERWRFGTGGEVESSPAVVDGTVYVGSNDRNVYALDVGDGTERWRFETGGEVESSPAVVDGTVYVGCSVVNEANVYALSAADGGEEWRFETGGGVTSSPAVVDDTVYVGSTDRQLYALSAADGTERWSFEADGTPSPPAVVDGTVYFGTTGEGTAYALDASDGTERWSLGVSGFVRASPAVANGTVYVTSGAFNVSALTGRSPTPSPTPEPTPSPTPEPAGPTGGGGDPAEGSGSRDDREMLPLLFGMVGLGGAGAGAWWYTRRRGDSDVDGPDGGESTTRSDATPRTRTSPSGRGAADPTGGAERIDAAMVPDEIPDAPTLSVDFEALREMEPIGVGGNADVKRAVLATPDGDVRLAIKEPRMSGTLHTDQVERMLDEAETWARLDDHDHVVGVVDYGSAPTPWIAMEYMDGGHLGERCGEMRLPQALWTGVVLARAVRHAHRRGVAHLDLKPENVLFRTVEDAWDVPKIADWGLSKHLLDHSTSVEGLSPQYAAPEQFTEEYGPTDDVTDIYQLGAVLYELFTGRPPFEGEAATVMQRALNESPTPPSEVASVPEALDGILLTALAKERDDRYDDVIYLRDDLRELFGDR